MHPESSVVGAPPGPRETTAGARDRAGTVIAKRRVPPWRVTVPLAVLAIGAAALQLALAAGIAAPTTHPDELGYLDNARFLARGGWPPETEYHPGFSLLLVPFWAVLDHPLAVWRGAQAVNAALAAIGIVFAWLLAGRLGPALGRWTRLGVTAAVGLYGPLLLTGSLALAERLFVTAFLGTAILAARASERPSAVRWGTLALAAAGLVLVHPRALPIVPAVAGLGLWQLRLRRDAGALLAAALLGTAALGVTFLLVDATQGAPLNAFSAYDAGGVLRRNLTSEGLRSLPFGLAGQLLTVSAATFGLAPAGLVACARRWRSGVHAFCALAFIGIWLVSSLFMNLGDRADKLVYGRYLEAALGPLVIAALAWSWRPVLAWGVGVTAACGVIVAVGRSADELALPRNPVNVLAIEPVLRHLDTLAPLAVAAAAVAACGLVAVAMAPSRALAAIVATALTLAVAADGYVSHLRPGGEARDQQHVAADATRRAIELVGEDAVPCVGYDATTTEDYFFRYFAYRFWVPGQPFAWFDTRRDERPCGSLVVSGDRRLDRRIRGARMVVPENHVDDALWALPGAVARELEAAGWLMPAGPPGPLPAEAQRARVEVIGDGRVRVTHAGGGSPWPNRFGLRDARFAVRLETTGAVVDLPRSLLPGESVVVEVPDGPVHVFQETVARFASA